MPVLGTTDNPLRGAEKTGFPLDSARRSGSVCPLPRPIYTTAFGQCGLNLCDV
mgnify:FL=1